MVRNDKGSCWTDNKSYFGGEIGSCWTDNKSYVGVPFPIIKNGYFNSPVTSQRLHSGQLRNMKRKQKQLMMLAARA